MPHIKHCLLSHSRLLWLGSIAVAGVLGAGVFALLDILWLGDIHPTALLLALITSLLTASLFSFFLCSRIKADQSLREQQRVLSQAERLAHVGAWSYEPGTDEFHPSGELQRIFGVSAPVMTLEQVTALVHPEDLPGVTQSVESLLQEGAKYDLCHRIIQPVSGEIRHLHVQAETVDCAEPCSHRILGASQDITDQVATETALKLSEARYRMIVESAQEGIVLLDGDYGCLLSNPKMAELLGYSPEEIQGRRLSDFMDKDWRASTEHERHLHGGTRAGRRNLKFRRKDGSELWAQACFSPIADTRGTEGDTLVMITDITERMRLEELLQNHVRKLEDIVHRKDEFLAQLGHELRNPLAPLSLSAQLLKNGSVQQQELAQCYESIERQTQHLSRLVDDLLDVSRVGRDVIQHQKKPLALSALIQQAVEISRPHVEANCQQLELRLTRADLWIEGDEIRLLQVLTNLLNNAAKFTPPEGHIRLSLEAHEDEAVIRIEDDGVGIAPEDLHRVFELFAQIHAPVAQGNDGLGIGLFLAHQLVGLHGGRLEALSEGVGKGSEFVVNLRLADAPNEVVGAAEITLSD